MYRQSVGRKCVIFSQILRKEDDGFLCLDGFYANRGDLLGFLFAGQLFTVCGRSSPLKKLAVGRPRVPLSEIRGSQPWRLVYPLRRKFASLPTRSEIKGTTLFVSMNQTKTRFFKRLFSVPHWLCFLLCFTFILKVYCYHMLIVKSKTNQVPVVLSMTTGALAVFNYQLQVLSFFIFNLTKTHETS